jgi:hypothetical protein
MKEFGTDNGVLYVERPEDALDKAIEIIKAGTIEAHGEKARQFVGENDWDTVVDEFEEVLVNCTHPLENGACDDAISILDVANLKGQRHE